MNGENPWQQWKQKKDSFENLNQDLKIEFINTHFKSEGVYDDMDREAITVSICIIGNSVARGFRLIYLFGTLDLEKFKKDICRVIWANSGLDGYELFCKIKPLIQMDRSFTLYTRFVLVVIAIKENTVKIYNP